MRPFAATVANLAVIVGLVLAPPPGRACELPVCTVPGDKHTPRVASDGAGGAFIAWDDFRNGSDGDLYIQRVTSGLAIAPGWPLEGIALVAALRAQGVARMVPDGAGGVIVVWLDFRNIFSTQRDIYAQRIMADGSIALGWPTDGLPVCTLSGDQWEPEIASDGAGGAIIVWEDYRAGGNDPHSDVSKGDVYGVRLLPDGSVAPGWTANGSPVCTEPGGQWSPSVIEDGAGGAVVAWADLRNYAVTGGDVYATRITSSGEIAPGWSVAGVPLVIAPDAQGSDLQLVSDGAGGAIAAWTDFRNEPLCCGSYGDIYAQRVTATGTIPPGWPSDGQPIAVATSYQFYPDMIADGAGGAFIVWEDYRDYENTNADLFGQRITGNGTVAPGWTSNGQRLATGPGWQLGPSLALDGQGGLLFAYESYGGAEYDLYAQRVHGDGTFPTGWSIQGRGLCVDFGADDSRPVAVSDGSGGMLIAAQHVVPGAADIYAAWVRGDVPTAALVSLESAEARSDVVTLTWYGADATGREASIERRAAEGEWRPLANVSADGSGRFRYEDRAVTAGARYGYRLAYASEGEQLYTADYWVDVPLPAFALHGAQPNPVIGDLVVGFSLASADPARLDVYDLAGRRVLEYQVGTMGVGTHRINVAPGRRLPAGVFTVVLTQGTQRAVSRAVVIR